MVARHDVRPAQHHLVTLADLDLGARQRRSDGADLVVVGVVDRRTGGVLGHAVALEDQDARGVEPLGDLAVERGGARDEEPHATAEALTDLAEDELVEDAVLHLEGERHRLAVALERVDRETHLEGLVEDLLLRTALGLLHRDDAPVGLLEDARRGAHEGRLDDPEVLDDPVHAAVDRGGEAAGQLGREQHLAERVRHRQPQELQVVLAEDALHLDGGALVDPRAVQQAHALGATGRAGGVDQGGELLGLDRRDRRGDGVGVLGEVGVAQGGQRVHRDDVVPVGGRVVEADQLDDRGQLGAVLGDLRDLRSVLREEHAAFGVTQDVRRVLGVRRRVDRGRGTSGAHHREIGQDPLVAGARRDAHALLALEAQRLQTRGEARDQVADLPPGHRLPGVTHREAVRLPVRGRLDTVPEQDGDVGDELVEERGITHDRHAE
ncbi:unannotated protein [freshwater metagenome]|uniref:Unannotated protein n=1 Tax=freshwater metagenome TaxID=449393 RepID=A0A6J6SC22_9ZZZZ